MNLLKKIFLNDNIVFVVIFINALIIFLEESNISNSYIMRILEVGDIICSIFFIIEMITKHIVLGVRGYWRIGWNKVDGILVLLSLPSVIMFFLPIKLLDVSVLMTLRLLRVLRFFRIMHFFPDFAKIIDGFKLAMRQSYAVLLSFFVIIIIFGLINCSLFGEFAPEYFGTPLASIFSVFQLCTIEGWYDIPNAVAEGSGSEILGHIISIYFCILLIMGGIIGMSFINSVFVDAMVSDNNDQVEDELSEIKKQLEQITKMLEESKSNKE